MTKLISVQFQNFQSYGSVPSKVDLTTPGTTMIIGENIDDGGSNGVGKSTIINAISYGLYDKPVSDISKDGLINNINGKNMEVIIIFEKNKHTYKVRRHRKMKGNGVELWEDDIEITPDSISTTNTKIERILGMPHDLFVRVIVFSAINTQFLNLPMRNQADMLEELLDLKMLSDKAAILKERIKDVTRSLEMEDVSIEQSNRDCERFVAQLKTVDGRITTWDDKHNTDLGVAVNDLALLNKVNLDAEESLQDQAEELSDQCDTLKNTIDTTQLKLNVVNNTASDMLVAEETALVWDEEQKDKIETIQAKIVELESVDIEEQTKQNNIYFTALTETKQLDDDASEIEKELITLDGIITENGKELAHLKDNTCPYCNQAFADTKTNINKCTTAIKEAADNTNELVVALDGITKQKSKLKKISSAAAELITTTVDGLTGVVQDITSNTERLETLVSALNPHTKRAIELKENFDPKERIKFEKALDKAKLDFKKAEVKLKAVDGKRDLDKRGINEHKRQLVIAETTVSAVKKETNVWLDQLQDLYSEQFNDEMTYIELFKSKKLPINDLEAFFKSVTPHTVDTTEGNKFVYVSGTKRSDELHQTSEHQKFLLKLLTNKNSFIRKTMLNQSIPYLNVQLDKYLKTMGLPHSVCFTPKMEVSINRLGKPLQYGNLSNGQQCRVNLALSFAFRDVLQYLHDPLNVWVLDEVLDVGLDAGGIQNAVSMIKRKAEEDGSSIFVISHRDLDNAFTNKLNVQLKDGFSTVLN